MSRDRDASSSDVDRARALTRRLGQRDKGDASAPIAAPDSGYIRFSAGRFSVPTPPVPQPPRPARLAPPPGPLSWGALADWAFELVGADGVFVTDARGLLVALAGGATHEHAEAMGSRLVLAFEHADRMEADANASRFMAVEFDGVVVSGLRIELPEGGRLVLGIAASTALDPALRADIERAVLGAAARG